MKPNASNAANGFAPPTATTWNTFNAKTTPGAGVEAKSKASGFVVPNRPKTPLHTIRAPNDLWRAGLAKAATEERSLSDVIREFLAEYVGGYPSSEAAERRS